MITFTNLKWRNLLSTGDAWTEISLNKHTRTLIVGENGHGKCVRGSTLVDIDADEETLMKLRAFLQSNDFEH